jgi:dTDP-glucose 4,6-dehydratase
MTMSHCSNNYGPYQHSEKLIPTIIQACRNWQPIPIYGDGSNIRDWLYVTDHCAGIYAILTQSRVGETYNLGGNNELNNLTIAEHICQRMDEREGKSKSYKTLINFVKDRPGHDWRYAIDFSKSQRELQWQPQETFASGIDKTLDFYLTSTNICSSV